MTSPPVPKIAQILAILSARRTACLTAPNQLSRLVQLSRVRLKVYCTREPANRRTKPTIHLPAIVPARTFGLFYGGGTVARNRLVGFKQRYAGSRVHRLVR